MKASSRAERANKEPYCLSGAVHAFGAPELTVCSIMGDFVGVLECSGVFTSIGQPCVSRLSLMIGLPWRMKKAMPCSPLFWDLSSASLRSLALSCIGPFIKACYQRSRRRTTLRLPSFTICSLTLTVATAYSAIIVACSTPKAFWGPAPVSFSSSCVITSSLAFVFLFILRMRLSEQ